MGTRLIVGRRLIARDAFHRAIDADLALQRIPPEAESRARVRGPRIAVTAETAQTTDTLLLFATNGRFYALGADKLPGGRGHGEPFRLMIDIEEAVREMGEDYWPFGFEKNEKVLETFLKYHYECGLSKRLLKPEELFAPETHESFKI